ncbi:signal recognition particle, SRP19 subunit [Xylaria castorea]|nr:signal recognition particle, SRP19 subunit [Xylaria castorea]
MSHPRIEEVSDSDDDVSDPSEGDIDDFQDSDILRAVPTKPTPSQSQARASPSPQQQQQQQQQQHTEQQAPQPGLQPADIKDYQMLYPVYFDAARTRAQGRRVSASLAVKNPLAREIANACAALRLSPVFEAHRTHPKDWANPGRVRVALKEARARNHPVKNKHHLYVVVAKYLREHPVADDSPALRQGLRGMGLGGGLGGAGDLYADGKPWPRPAVPKGWKLGDLLPAYSAAMTGGGVSENAFKDMMREMQNQGGGAPGGGGGGGGMPGMGMPGMNADMMSMLQGMGMGGGGGGGGGGGPAIGGSEGGGKKGKKGKK